MPAIENEQGFLTEARAASTTSSYDRELNGLKDFLFIVLKLTMVK